MRTQASQQKIGRKKRKTTPQRQINMRVDPVFYRALETVAQQDRRSISQMARQLLEEGLKQRVRGGSPADDLPSQEIATLAHAGRAFDWLAEEQDIYDDTDGEPL